MTNILLGGRVADRGRSRQRNEKGAREGASISHRKRRAQSQQQPRMSLQHSQQFVMMSGSIAQAVPTEAKTTAAMMARRFMGNLLQPTPIPDGSRPRQIAGSCQTGPTRFVTP